MSLRRTALSRKAELQRGGRLRRTPMPRRKSTLAARSVKATKRPRDTGPDQVTRRLVLERAGGCCELCGRLLHDGQSWLAVHSVHHRRPRGAGGSSWPGINLASNLLLLCGDATSPDGCHAFVEAHRTSAYDEGWLVRQSHDPAEVMVTICAGLWVPRIQLPAADPCSDLALSPDAIWQLPSDVEPSPATRRVFLTGDGDYQELAA